MKAIYVNQKTMLVRHWCKWYTVRRSGEEWIPYKVDPKAHAPKVKLPGSDEMAKAGKIMKSLKTNK